MYKEQENVVCLLVQCICTMLHQASGLVCMRFVFAISPLFDAS